MFSYEAEYKFVKEFEDFSIGHFDDGWPHYNGHELLDAKTSENYLDSIEEIFQKLTLEVETNLIFLAESKVKRQRYLGKIIARLEDTRELLHDYHYEILEDEHEIDGWMPIAWNATQSRIDKLLIYCRKEFNTLSVNSNQLSKGKEYSRDSSLCLLMGNDKLGSLYHGLVNAKIIDRIPFKQFETHFSKLQSIEAELTPINWNKEKYLLVYMFDELDNRSCLDKSYKANCDSLLSRHFTHKGKSITPRQLASARHTFKKRMKGCSETEAEGNHFLILGILVRVLGNPKQESTDSLF